MARTRNRRARNRRGRVRRSRRRNTYSRRRNPRRRRNTRGKVGSGKRVRVTRGKKKRYRVGRAVRPTVILVGSRGGRGRKYAMFAPKGKFRKKYPKSKYRVVNRRRRRNPIRRRRNRRRSNPLFKGGVGKKAFTAVKHAVVLFGTGALSDVGTTYILGAVGMDDKRNEWQGYLAQFGMTGVVAFLLSKIKATRKLAATAAVGGMFFLAARIVMKRGILDGMLPAGGSVGGIIPIDESLGGIIPMNESLGMVGNVGSAHLGASHLRASNLF